MIGHLLTQTCTIKGDPTFDKFGNPSSLATTNQIKCRLIECKKYKKDSQMRVFEVDAELTTQSILTLADRVEFNNIAYCVMSCNAWVSPRGIIGYKSDLITRNQEI